MFTGIVQDTGSVLKTTPYHGGLQMHIATSLYPEISQGDSVCVEGVCSTATQVFDGGFCVDYLEETLKKTTLHLLPTGSPLNLELSATLHTRIGGHLVSGHVDERGSLVDVHFNDPWSIITVQGSPSFKHFLVPKGSIAIDGIALTIVDVFESSFTCHLIPYTQQHTTLGLKKKGHSINLEYDITAKYLYNFFDVFKHTLQRGSL